MKNGLSFDVEEYFHALNLRSVAPQDSWEQQPRRVADSTRQIVELLARHEVRATFFFLGWVAERDPDLVRHVSDCGHEIASHGMSHQMANELGEEAFLREARESKAILEDVTGKPVRGFRASTFSITKSTRWAFESLIEAGYEYDSSVFPVRHDRYGYPTFSRVPVTVDTPSGSILEIPMLTLRRLGMNLPAAGGGYLRLLPLYLINRALKEMNGVGLPGVVYLHPWEFDPDQPRLLRGGLSAFRHYFGLNRTSRKLEKLLRAHRFGPLGEIRAATKSAVSGH